MPSLAQTRLCPSVLAMMASITVWGRGTQPDYMMNTRVELTRNGGLVAAFGGAATANLLPCWQQEQPAF